MRGVMSDERGVMSDVSGVISDVLKIKKTNAEI